MAKKTTRGRGRRSRREPLVHSHLERVSRDLLENHPDVVRSFIGRNAGIYALYKGDELYYVGLATGLSWRLRSHKRNRHGQAWDRFSIFLTIKDQHLREIESLILKIAKPKGNKQGGRPAGSRDLKKRIASAIRQKQKNAITALFTTEKPEKAVSAHRDTSTLLRLLPMGARLQGINKNKPYRARVRKDGRISFGGRIYPSLSSAAKAAIKTAVNGWWFWQVERGKGNWVRLKQIRKAGTPIYPS